MAEGYKTRKAREGKTVDIDSLVTGSVPPQAEDIEEAVLSALLIEPGCLDDTMEEISDDRCFYRESNRVIFQAMKALYLKHDPVDIYTVTEKLFATGKVKTGDSEVDAMELAGGAARIAELSTRVGAAANIEYYSKILKQKFIQRELITASYRILKTAFDNSVDMDYLTDMAQTEIFKAVDSNTTKDARDIGSVINMAMTDLEKFQTMEGSYSGVPSGFQTLDGITMGFQASDLIILAARPSVGKTAFALNIARNVAVQNYPVAMFSLEMPAIQLAKRMMVSETGIDGKKLKGGVKLDPGDWEMIETQIKELASAPLYIDDTPSLPVMEFRSKVKKLVKQKGVKLIIVDYLQLMQGPAELRGMREQEVAAISRTLKATAKEHNVPIIALSQLSRNTVNRQGSNNRPQLSDLRESGSIEQDADMVLFLHRLDYQNMGDDTVVKGDTRLIIAKHRNGEIGEIPLIFRDSLARFEDGSTANLSFDPAQFEERPSAMNNAPSGGYDNGFDNYSPSSY